MINIDFNTKLYKTATRMFPCTDDIIRRMKKNLPDHAVTADIRSLNGMEYETEIKIQTFSERHPFSIARATDDDHVTIALPLMIQTSKDRTNMMSPIYRILSELDFHQHLSDDTMQQMTDILSDELLISSGLAGALISHIASCLKEENYIRDPSVLLEFFYASAQCLLDERDLSEIINEYENTSHFALTEEIQDFHLTKHMIGNHYDSYFGHAWTLSVVTRQHGLIHHIAQKLDLLILDNRQSLTPEDTETMSMGKIEFYVDETVIDQLMRKAVETLIIECSALASNGKRRVTVYYPKDENASEHLVNALKLVGICPVD